MRGINLHGILLGLLVQSVCSCAPAAQYHELSRAPQIIYQQGVPHTDRQGRSQLEVTAASFFPRCGYESIPGTLADLKAAGFNCVKPWGGAALASVLLEANQTDMQVIGQLGVAACDFRVHPDCNPEPHGAAQITALTQQLVAQVSDPAILAWYIEEEPTACINPPSNCLERFKNYQLFRSAIKAIDPIHPSFALDLSLPYASALEDWNLFNAVGDIAANDNYPFAKGNENTLESSAADYTRLLALNHQAKPVWITVQAFAVRSHWLLPTSQQLRAEVFTAIVHGATGIIYFALDDWATRNAQVIGIAASTPASYPQQHPGDASATVEQINASRALWSQTVALNAELQRLQAALLSPTATLSYRVAMQGHAVSTTPIRTLLKSGKPGSYTLLLVNIDDAPLNAQITLPSQPIDPEIVDQSGTRHAWACDRGACTDSIEGFGVRVYEFRLTDQTP